MQLRDALILILALSEVIAWPRPLCCATRHITTTTCRLPHGTPACLPSRTALPTRPHSCVSPVYLLQGTGSCLAPKILCASCRAIPGSRRACHATCNRSRLSCNCCNTPLLSSRSLVSSLQQVSLVPLHPLACLRLLPLPTLTVQPHSSLCHAGQACRGGREAHRTRAMTESERRCNGAMRKSRVGGVFANGGLLGRRRRHVML